MEIALAYLARGRTENMNSVLTFLALYKEFPPGMTHKLHILCKRWPQGKMVLLRELAQAHNATIVELPDDGFDWGAYIRFAQNNKSPWLCFLNTHSRPVVANWLKLMAIHADSKNVGAVGATGSWGSLLPARFINPSSSTKFVLYPAQLALNVWQYATNFKDFPHFPNPHLRSNGFLISRKVFCNFIERRRIPRNKREAHILEHGKQGLGAYLRDKGLVQLVVGKDKSGYLEHEWDTSQTFRTPGQHNLLIRDNQTDFYERSSPETKRMLELEAWGKAFTGAQARDLS